MVREDLEQLEDDRFDVNPWTYQVIASYELGAWLETHGVAVAKHYALNGDKPSARLLLRLMQHMGIGPVRLRGS